MALALWLVPLALALRVPLRTCSARAYHVGSAVASGEDAGQPLTSDGGVRKWLLHEAAPEATLPGAGATVRVLYTCAHPNGTLLDCKHEVEPLEFQLGAGEVIDGLQRGVSTMRVGERAVLSCEPRWVHGTTVLDPRIPTDVALRYEVELLAWEEGPARDEDNEEFDVHTYRSSLQGKAAAAGRTARYSWSESGEEVTLWLPLADGVQSNDIRCEFGRHRLSVWVGAEAKPRVNGELKGRADPEECYWVIDDEYEGARHVQVVLGKAGVFTCWDGALMGEENLGV